MGDGDLTDGPASLKVFVHEDFDEDSVTGEEAIIAFDEFGGDVGKGFVGGQVGLNSGGLFILAKKDCLPEAGLGTEVVINHPFVQPGFPGDQIHAGRGPFFGEKLLRGQ